MASKKKKSTGSKSLYDRTLVVTGSNLHHSGSTLDRMQDVLDRVPDGTRIRIRIELAPKDEEEDDTEEATVHDDLKGMPF